MHLRLSIAGTIVAAAYILGAAYLMSSEMHGNGCMGWCFGLATFPEVFLLRALPDSYFYTTAWEHVVVWLFGGGVVAVNAFVLYVVFGGVTWWRS